MAKEETELKVGEDFFYLTRDNWDEGLFQELMVSKEIAIDTETAVPRDPERRKFFRNEYNLTRTGEAAPFDPHTAEVRLVQLRGEETKPVVIDLWKIDPHQTKRIKDFILGYSGCFLGQNIKFDLKQIAGTLGVWLDHKATLFDTMQASILLANALGVHERGHRLLDLARDFLGVNLDKTEQASDWSKPNLSEEQLEYAAYDVTHLHQLKVVLEAALLDDLGMPEALKLEMAVIGPTARMEYNGVPINLEIYQKVQEAAQYAMPGLLGQIGEYFYDKIKQPLSITYLPVVDRDGNETEVPFRLPWGGGKAGKDFLMSRANLVKTMLQELGLQDDKGEPLDSTAKGILEVYRETEPGVKMLLDYWNLVKQAQFDYKRYYHPKTNRLHPRYNISGASTGRFSSTSPNLKL